MVYWGNKVCFFDFLEVDFVFLFLEIGENFVFYFVRVCILLDIFFMFLV